MIELWNADDLNGIRLNLTGAYIQMADIDLTTYPNWEPIGGYYDNPFVGQLNGNGYTISNLSIDVSIYEGLDDQESFGLFGSISGSARLENITLSNVLILGQANTAALVGKVFNDQPCDIRILNCSVTSGLVQGERGVGGLIGNGHVQRGALSRIIVDGCSTYCQVLGTNNGIGGLIGRIGDGNGDDELTVVIRRSSSHGNVTHTCTDAWGGFNTGGLIGRVGTWSSHGLISVLIEDCYTTSDIFINPDSDTVCSDGSLNIGGLIGNTARGVTISRCFANNLIDYNPTETLGMGCLVGYDHELEDLIIGNSYYNLTTCTLDNGLGVGILEIDMTNTGLYTNWDFDTRWIMDTDYPILRAFYEIEEPFIRELHVAEDQPWCQEPNRAPFFCWEPRQPIIPAPINWPDQQNPQIIMQGIKQSVTLILAKINGEWVEINRKYIRDDSLLPYEPFTGYLIRTSSASNPKWTEYARLSIDTTEVNISGEANRFYQVLKIVEDEEIERSNVLYIPLEQ